LPDGPAGIISPGYQQDALAAFTLANDNGLLAVTLRYPYEIPDAKAYFEDIPDLKLPDEMKQLATKAARKGIVTLSK
jgi:non-homologous end joining protein Ku